MLKNVTVFHAIATWYNSIKGSRQKTSFYGRAIKTGGGKGPAIQTLKARQLKQNFFVAFLT